MSKLGFSFQLQLTFTEPVKRHAFVLRCLPQSNSRQRVISSSCRILPECSITVNEDAFGLQQSGTVMIPHAAFSVQAGGIIDVFPGIAEKAAEPWMLGPYRRFTELTAPGPELIRLAEQLPSHDIPDAVMELLADRFSYLPGSTDAATTAEEAAAAMHGVCQDESHIMLSLLRIKKIPCRYCMGYMLGEGSTHAWVEVLEDDQWVGLDPTNHRPVNDEYIRIGIGRDADDCPVNRGIFSGTAKQLSQSCLSVWNIDE